MKHFDYGGTGTPLHSLHANGYPPDCYKPLFELLKTEYHVFGMPLRPLWDEAKIDDIKDWQPFSDDLRFFLSSQPDPVIGVGHSIGAVVKLMFPNLVLYYIKLRSVQVRYNSLSCSDRKVI